MIGAGTPASLALELERRVAAGGAPETRAIPEGLVFLNRALEEIYFLNAVVLDAPLPPGLDGAALAGLAEQHLGHLAHRFVRVDEEAAGAWLAEDLVAAGWEQRRTLLMVRGPDGDPRPGRDPRARLVSSDEHRAVMLANFRETDYPEAIPELPELLVRAQDAMLAGTASRRYGAGEDGGLQSMCELYLDPDVRGVRMAMIEQVATLKAYRERGLARAVTALALSDAIDWGAELIYIPADADDWPQLIYAKLGFEAVGVQWSFLWRRPPHSQPT